jgi:hypothetical protein
MELPETRIYETRVAEQEAAMRDTGSACEISVVSEAPPRWFAHSYEEEREEIRALQQNRYRCRAALFE